MGFDFFKQSVDTVFTEYIDRYNSDQTSAYRKINTYKSAPFRGAEYKVARNGEISVSTSEGQIDYSVAFTAKSGDDASVDGKFTISLLVE